MSFLGDLVSSIGTNKAPPRPQTVLKPPASAPAPAPSVAAHSKPIPRPTPSLPSTRTQISQTTSLKRKADDRDGKLTEGMVKSTLALGISKGNSRPPTPNTNGPKSIVSKPSETSANPTSTVPGKAPPKGSYADLMARAKQAQETRTQSKVGLIKHQATAKEKVSKLAERRRGEQEKSKTDRQKGVQKSGVNGRSTKDRRSASPLKTDRTDRADKIRVPKAPRPPLHAPATSSYKGTMGKSTNKPRDPGAARAPKRSRYDEYLDTDEDEDDEIEDYDDGYGYGSDVSSDMEAGMDDVEREEALALRAAREDDAKELAYENQLKREKEEKRRKLAALAKKAR